MIGSGGATREAALARLSVFLPRAGAAYAADRNHDNGPGQRDNVSQLSPFIRHRLITEREVCAAVLARHTLRESEKFIQEVLWRTYWKGWLQLRPGVWTSHTQELAHHHSILDQDGGLRLRVESAMAGTTGIEGFDDWAQELTQTGYLHNHARMWFASIWIFTLRLPWVLGADFFHRHLLDGDAASNTLSWRWVAGLQTVGKTYAASQDNIRKYTGGRFAPKGLAPEASVVNGASPEPPRVLEPLPERFDGPCAVLLTQDDLGVESLPVDWRQVRAAAVADLTGGRTERGVGEQAAAFGRGAARDTISRLADLAPEAAVRATPFDCLAAEDLLSWLHETRSTTLVILVPQVGPTADLLAVVAPALKREGVRLIHLRRAWDAAAWPFATKGFFAFKEKIPDLLRRERLI